jgi:hypothetical protein
MKRRAFSEIFFAGIRILLNNPRLQAEGFSICRLEVDSCFRHSGFTVTWIPFSNGMTDAVRHLDAALAGMTNFHFDKGFNHPR